MITENFLRLPGATLPLFAGTSALVVSTSHLLDINKREMSQEIALSCQIITSMRNHRHPTYEMIKILI